MNNKILNNEVVPLQSSMRQINNTNGTLTPSGQVFLSVLLSTLLLSLLHKFDSKKEVVIERHSKCHGHGHHKKHHGHYYHMDRSDEMMPYDYEYEPMGSYQSYQSFDNMNNEFVAPKKVQNKINKRKIQAIKPHHDHYISPFL